MKKLFMLLLMTACSQVSEVEEFQSEADSRGCLYIPHQVYFTNLVDESAAGYCFPAVGVFISKEKWSDYGKFQRLELIFHELGHCSLGYAHGDDAGIMSPYMHDEGDIEKSWAVWVDEFFAACK